MARQMLYVYSGCGASEESLAMLLKSLQRIVTKTPYAVQAISPEDIKEGSWHNNAALLAIGGGYDLGFIKALGPQGVTSIKQYVNEGGSYLGICAGGYFGCDSIEFDKDGPLEVCGERDLKFYSGTCVGPCFPGFKYNSHAGACATKIKWLQHTIEPLIPDSNPKHFFCYFNGGGYFTTPDKDTNSSPLAVFENVENSPIAIVYSKVGRGRAVLTGVHPEYIAEDLDASDKDLKSTIPLLKEHAELNNAGLKVLLQLLGLEFN